MLQLDLSDPVNTALVVVMVVVLCIWIAVELKYEGAIRNAVRIACAFILSALFMVLMFTLGMIVF
ncbi:MAG: hypothetical protein ACXADC_18140 [Candidatus Thorarchaeota archaeon]